MATNSEKIAEFRKNNETMIDGVMDALKLIQGAKGKDLSRNGLYNVGIIYNNKISELIRIFNQHDLDFFDGNAVTEFIQYKLNYVYSNAIERLNSYVENNLATYGDEFCYIKNGNRKELNQYKELTEIIFNYDIEKDLLDSIEMMLHNQMISNPEFCQMFYAFGDTIKTSVRNTLEKLGYTNLAEECANEVEYQHQVLVELFRESGMDSGDESSSHSL